MPSSTLPFQRVALFVATTWEMHAVMNAGTAVERTRVAGYPAAVLTSGRMRWYVIQTGVGPVRAGRVAMDVLSESRWDAMLSTGFAGGLRGGDIGAVLIGTSVLAVPQQRVSVVAPALASDSRLIRILERQRAKEPAGFLQGAFVSVDYVVGREEDKRALAALYPDAVGVDMESAALAAVGRECAVPFAIVRTISDRVQDSLPLDFNPFLAPRTHVWGVAREAVRFLVSPRLWGGLLQLRHHSRSAASHLTHFLQGLIADVQAANLNEGQVSWS